MNPSRIAAFTILVCALVWYANNTSAPSCAAPAVGPAPHGVDGRPKPWRPRNIQASVAGSTAPDGTELLCDLPRELHLKNIGGSDGAGLCVFASLSHSARYQNVEPLKEFMQWMHQYPGGGYPEKVKQMIGKICKERGLPEPSYIQVQDDDLEILKAACKSGRMPGVTYGFSPSGRYGGQRISHMVSLPHADDKWFAVLDNNFPGTIEWMTPSEFKRAYTSGGHSGWSVIFLTPSPPPVPHQ